MRLSKVSKACYIVECISFAIGTIFFVADLCAGPLSHHVEAYVDNIIIALGRVVILSAFGHAISSLCLRFYDKEEKPKNYIAQAIFLVFIFFIELMIINVSYI